MSEKLDTALRYALEDLAASSPYMVQKPSQAVVDALRAIIREEVERILLEAETDEGGRDGG